MSIARIIGIGLMALGLISSAIGVYALYRFKNFYTKASVASLIDTAGFLLMIFGLILIHGLAAYSLKLILLIILVLLLNPLANHYIVRGAHSSGHRLEKE